MNKVKGKMKEILTKPLFNLFNEYIKLNTYLTDDDDIYIIDNILKLELEFEISNKRLLFGETLVIEEFLTAFVRKFDEIESKAYRLIKEEFKDVRLAINRNKDIMVLIKNIEIVPTIQIDNNFGVDETDVTISIRLLIDFDISSILIYKTIVSEERLLS